MNSILKFFLELLNNILIKFFKILNINLKLSDILIIWYYKVINKEELSNKKIIFNYEDYNNFPLEFEPSIFRTNNDKFAQISDEELFNQFRNNEIEIGSIFNKVVNRKKFSEIFNSLDGNKLEIGPFNNPILEQSEKNFFSDILTKDEIISQAKLNRLNTKSVPNIDYITKEKSLEKVVPPNLKFVGVISCQNIEHYPCLISHIKSIEAILEGGGFYFISVPDKRFSSDYFQQESNIIDIVSAYVSDDKSLKIKNIIEGLNFVTHNIPHKHWIGDHGENPYENLNKTSLESMLLDIKDRQKNNEKLDYHSWRFTPNSFRILINKLNDLEITNLQLKRLYPTIKGSSEFFVILEKKFK